MLGLEPRWVKSEMPLNGIRIAAACWSVVFPGVIPHKQGNRQSPFVDTKVSNWSRADSGGIVGAAVNVDDWVGPVLGSSVGVAAAVGANGVSRAFGPEVHPTISASNRIVAFRALILLIFKALFVFSHTLQAPIFGIDDPAKQ